MKNVRISLFPIQYCTFVTLRLSDSSFDVKNGELFELSNYFLETEKMLYCTH